MTLNQLLMAISKAGYPVKIKFDDNAMFYRSYPYEIHVNNIDIMDNLLHYQEHIESSMNSIAYHSGSYSINLNSKTTFTEYYDYFNYTETEEAERKLSFVVNKSDFEFLEDSLSIWMTIKKENSKFEISSEVHESCDDEKHVKLFTEKILSYCKHAYEDYQYLEIELDAVNETKETLEYKASIEEAYYTLEKKGLGLFETLDIDLKDRNLDQVFIEALKVSEKEFYNIIDTIEEE